MGRIFLWHFFATFAASIGLATALAFPRIALELENALTFGLIFAALFAAWLGVAGVSKQMRQQIELEEHIRKRRFTAAKTSLPLLIDKRFNEADRVLKHLCNPQTGFRENWHAFDEDWSAFHTLVENGDDEDVRFFTQLRSIEQIIIARSKDVLDTLTPDSVSKTSSPDQFQVDYEIRHRSCLIHDWLAYLSILSGSIEFARDSGVETPPSNFRIQEGYLRTIEWCTAAEQHDGPLKATTTLLHRRYGKDGKFTMADFLMPGRT